MVPLDQVPVCDQMCDALLDQVLYHCVAALPQDVATPLEYLVRNPPAELYAALSSR